MYSAQLGTRKEDSKRSRLRQSEHAFHRNAAGRLRGGGFGSGAPKASKPVQSIPSSQKPEELAEMQPPIETEPRSLKGLKGLKSSSCCRARSRRRRFLSGLRRPGGVPPLQGWGLRGQGPAGAGPGDCP